MLSEMDIPSTPELRGQRDARGFASSAEAMAAVYECSAAGPEPGPFAAPPLRAVAGVPRTVGTGLPIGAICPHDDYLYAGRVYRRVLPAIRARTVFVLGVFHKYRIFAGTGLGRDLGRDANAGCPAGGQAPDLLPDWDETPLIFDAYPAWRSPDGPIAISPLRGKILRALSDSGSTASGGQVSAETASAGGPALAFVSNAMHDAEHSIEAVAYWLKHLNPDVELVPILVSTATFPRLEVLSAVLARAIAGCAGGVTAGSGSPEPALGPELALVISSDAVHYGADFGYTAFDRAGKSGSPGGCIDTLAKVRGFDRGLLEGALAGHIDHASARAFSEVCADPEDPTRYRHTWCGRFAVPFGLMLMSDLCAELGRPAPQGWPVAYATTLDCPLPRSLERLGLGTTAPAEFGHFVGLPGALYW